MRLSAWLPALVLAGPATAGAAGGFEVRHDPVACVPADRYAHFTAIATPAQTATRAELQFRVRPAGEWYSVAMTNDGRVWSAFLPRPMRPLAHFEYRIVMAAPDLATAETPAYAVRVADDAAPCTGGPDALVSVAAPIVVRVPPAAPLVPPVPAGFSPAGVVAAAELVPKARSTKRWMTLAGVAGGVAAAAVAAGSGSRPLLPEAPVFEFFGTSPAPGSVLSLSRDRLSVSVRISGAPGFRLDFRWRLELRAGEGEDVCVVVSDVAIVGPERPQVVSLTSGLTRLGACASRQRFDVETGRFSIVLANQTAYDQTYALPYHFEP